jgi:hypothetical protein
VSDFHPSDKHVPQVPTPRTDAFVSDRRFVDGQESLDAWAAFARQLERENLELTLVLGHGNAETPSSTQSPAAWIESGTFKAWADGNAQDGYGRAWRYKKHDGLTPVYLSPVSATLPTELTPMLLMNAAYCVEGNEVARDKRTAIRDKLLACAEALQAPAPETKTTILMGPNGRGQGNGANEAEEKAPSGDTYRGLWERFVSPQTGDATLLVKDAARYRWLCANGRYKADWWKRYSTHEELSAAIDEQLRLDGPSSP